MSHVVMHKKLAHALMEQAMTPIEHFAGGGLAGMLGATNGTVAEGPQMSSQDLKPQIQQQYGQQQDVYKQQQNLAQALGQQAQGQGPGQQLIAQQAGNNVSQQAALMASQRGASANPGMVARQAAQAAAPAQQQALNAQAGLTLQSQGALGNQQAQMANQALQAQSILQGATASQNSANLAAQGINAQVAGQNAQTNAQVIGGLISGGAGALAHVFNKGGEVPRYAAGGNVQPMGIQNYASPQAPSLGLQSGFGGLQSLGATLAGPQQTAQAQPMGNPYAGSGFTPEEMQLESNRQAMQQQGGIPMNEKAGGPIPGKAQVQGDSEKNDTQPAMLSPGEVVLPRSVTQGGNVEKKAIEFLRHLKGNKERGYGAVISAKKMSKGGKVGC